MRRQTEAAQKSTSPATFSTPSPPSPASSVVLKRLCSKQHLPFQKRPDYQPPRERAPGYTGQTPAAHHRGVLRLHEKQWREEFSSPPPGRQVSPPRYLRAARGTILEAVFSSTGLKFPAQRKSQWQPFQAPPPTNPRAQRPAIHTYQQLWRSKRRYGEWVGKEKGMGIWMVNCVNLSVAHAPTTNQP